MVFSDKYKPKPRELHELLRKRIEKNHPGEAPKRIEAILERIREIDNDIRTR